MVLSHVISKGITNSLIENKIIEENEKEIYEYCYYYLAENILYSFIVLLLGIVLQCFRTTLLFLCMFSFFRKYGGGFHASTEKKCAFLSNSVFSFVLLIIPKCHFFNSILWISIYFFSVLCILKLAPVENVNKKFTYKQKNQLRFLCCVGLIFFSIIFIYFFFKKQNLLFGTMSICALIVAISMLIGKYDYQRNNK